jgi:hypothetical protein
MAFGRARPTIQRAATQAEQKTAPLQGNIGPTGYERFKIETSPAPPRKKQPPPFNPVVSKTQLAKFLATEVLELGPKLWKAKYRKALLSRPCIYGVFDGRFGGFHPIKDRCVGCLRCFQEYPDICRVDRNPEFFRFADSYWIPEDPATATSSPVATVWHEAATGMIPVKGMGYREGFADRGWDCMWTDMSEIVRPTRDGVYGREYISTVVDVGRKTKFLEFTSQRHTQTSRTVQVSMPIVFDHLPPNLNNHSIISSIASASRRVGTLFIAQPDQSQRLRQDVREQMIPLLSASNVEENKETILKAPAVELTGFDPSTLQRVRELNPRAPVSVRLPLKKGADSVAAQLARDEVDIIHIFADYHGEEFQSEKPAFAKDLIHSVHAELVKECMRDEVTLIASGGITLAEHVPKAIICGADLVALNTTVLVALQVQFERECESSETGRIGQEKFDESWGEQRLVNMLASWHDQLIEILSAMGMRDVRRLRGDVGRAMFKEELEKETFA